ncbi:MAG TPA: hypothetical protein VGC91_19740 [Pyrinomonadaceae bacterium]|jgi:hypothetical protein
MYPSPVSIKSVRPSLLISLMLLFMLAGAACKRSAVESNANGNSSNTNSTAQAEDATSSTPPFSTKEPERYQATMVTSGVLGGQAGNIPGMSTLTDRQMFIARDGDKRRVETELLPGVKVAYLQLAGGRYMLYPAKKLYAEVKLDGSSSSNYSGLGAPSDFSADKLINTAPTGARYEKLGTEQVNGRTTTKYRVTNSTGSDAAQTVTIIWADEALGMPVKSESTSQDGTKYSMELRDIKQEVDAGQFELPKDYQKVEYNEIISKALPSLPDILGGDKENKENKDSKKGKK